MHLPSRWRRARSLLAAGFACALLLTGPNVPASANVQTLTGNYTYTQESWPQLARVRATLRLTF